MLDLANYLLSRDSQKKL